MHPLANSLPMTLISLLLFMLTAVTSPTAAVNLPDQKATADHQAHAKAGGPYYAVDWDGDGLEVVSVDASQSHTHFVDPGPPRIRGNITSYKWFSRASGTLLLSSNRSVMTADFFIGVTILELIVTDSTGDKAHAYTYVSVRKPKQLERRSPTVAHLHPASGPITGGTVVTVAGAAFYNHPIIVFGGVRFRPDILSETELTFRVPAAAKPERRELLVSNAFGTSERAVTFRYEDTQDNPVRFRPAWVRSKGGGKFRRGEVTCIVLGPDGRYYAGSRDGYIHVWSINRALVVQESCRSGHVGPARSVLGLAFNPAEPGPEEVPRGVGVYISTSTLAWPLHETGDGWENGRIEVWARPDRPVKKGKPCLQHVKTIVSGLPVSSGDHGVNALTFRADGTLLVAVGGATNAGVHRLKGEVISVAESPLSGAVLAFPLREAWFNGTIEYSERHNPATARVVSGSVSVFAAGIRNMFGMTIHSNGEVYGLSNGPNIDYGLMAVGCGKVGGEVAFSDTLLKVRWGAYYGHPNWNRGRDDKRQCVYVQGDSPGKGRAFSEAMAVVESSTNGIIEYTANRFDGSLRGHLILSQLSWTGTGAVTAVGLSAAGAKLVPLYNDSGIAVAMGPYGELLMPKYEQGTILALVPVEKNTPRLRVIAVTPARGRAGGGNFIAVTGDGLRRGVRILVGGVECREYVWERLGNEVKCRVPAYRGGARRVTVVAKRRDDVSAGGALAMYEYVIAFY